jgi:OOP family OmpA-OmpF porin
VDEDGCPTDDDNDGVPNHRDKCPDTRPGARVDKDGCEIVDSVVLDVVADGFDFDKSNLKPHMMNDLRTLADRIKASPGNEAIKIIGHTDSIGTEAYNQGLSERRAKSVANYLGKEGVDRGKMAISGKGESEPVADNRTDEGRARNRRVEVHTR